MEESGIVEGSDKSHVWHVDPLDGTTNFLHGIPQFAVSIGLEREGQLVAGVVYNPAIDEMYVAEKGAGAYLNNRRLRVAARRDIADSLIGMAVPLLGRANDHALFKRELHTMMAKVGNLRRLGAAALDLAFVAAGRLDGFWERGLKTWDMAAGIVLVREAGGFVSDADGGDEMMTRKSICCGNEVMQRELIALLRSA